VPAAGGRKGPSSSGFLVKRKQGGTGSTTTAAGSEPGEEVDDRLSPGSFPCAGHSSSCLGPRWWLPLVPFLAPGDGVDCGERETSVGADKNRSDTVKIRMRMTINFHRGHAQLTEDMICFVSSN
jgi:hypothetical protein